MIKEIKKIVFFCFFLFGAGTNIAIAEELSLIKEVIWSPKADFIALHIDNEIFLIGKDGKNKRSILKQEKIFGNLYWNSDGLRIFFLSRDKGIYAVRQLDIAFGNVKTLFSSLKLSDLAPLIDSGPFWDNKGEKFLIKTVNRKRKGVNLYLIDILAKKFDLIGEGIFLHPALSPRGDKIICQIESFQMQGFIAFKKVKDKKWLKMGLCPTGLKICTSQNKDIPFWSPMIGGQIYWDFTWSPNNKNVCFVAGDYWRRNTPLCILNTDSKQAFPLSNSIEHKYLIPKFSPDGKKIAFLGSLWDARFKKDPLWWKKAVIELKIINTNGKGLKTLAREKGIENFVWSPNGKKIAILKRDSEIKIINIK